MTILKFLPIAILGLLIFFGGHYLLYRAFVKFLGIANPPARVSLFVVIFLLSFSFVVASAMTRLAPGAFTKYFYIASASWLGIAINLLLAAFLIWILTWLAPLVGFGLDARLMSVVIFSLAVIFSAYGIWNALHPRINDVEVAIKNLPPQWENGVVVQLSDVHLGIVHGEDFLRGVVQKVNSLHPRMVLITGDLFDGMDGDLGAFVGPLNDIHAERGIFFVTGNHETYLGLDRTYSILKETGIKVLDNEMVNVDGLQIIGASYPAADSASAFVGSVKDTAAVIASLKNFDPAKPSILLHHAPTDIEEAKTSGISLQLSGHAHDGQLFPIQLIDWLVYGKYYYGLHTEGNFSIYTSSGVGTWGPPMRTGNVPEIVAIKLK